MRRLAPILAASALLVFAAAGCGGETVSASPETVEGTLPTTTATTPSTEGDPIAGKEIFASGSCGACHALADAGATGTVGPSLDVSKPSLELTIDRVTNGKGGMPAFKGQLSEQDIADVAAYIVQATSG